MSGFFFDDSAAVQRLFAGHAKWDGTPWMKHSCVAKAGADCLCYVEQVLGREAGVDGGDPFHFPRTSADYQSARTELRILKMLRGQMHVANHAQHIDPGFALPAASGAEIDPGFLLPAPKQNIDPGFALPASTIVDPQSARLASIFAELSLPPDRENLYLALFMPGDLVICRDGGQFHLLVMLTPPRFGACTYPTGVSQGNIHDTTFSKHIDALFRARALN